MKLPKAQDFLRYASGVALVLTSSSLLIFSLTTNKAKGAPPQPITGWQTVGAVVVDGKIEVISYAGNPNSTV
jgi:hypothetical protein